MSAACFTKRVLEAAALFGLDLDHLARPASQSPVSVPLSPGSVALVTGPSGSGKSTLLREIASMLHEKPGTRVIQPTDPSSGPLADRALVDRFDLALDEALAVLSRAGLAEASLFIRTARELSDGQRWRLALAHALHDAERSGGSAVIIVDEFASALDRLAATSLARSVARWVRGTRHVLVAAASSDDLVGPLAPDVLIACSLHGRVEVMTR